MSERIFVKHASLWLIDEGQKRFSMVDSRNLEKRLLKIDLNDKIEIAYALFGFVNVICEVLISQPKKIQEFYERNIPDGARNGIEKRDS